VAGEMNSTSGDHSMPQLTNCWSNYQQNRIADHSEALAEFVEDALFVEHFAAVPILVIVSDTKSQLTWQLPTHDILLHLLTLPIHILMILMYAYSVRAVDP